MQKIRAFIFILIILPFLTVSCKSDLVINEPDPEIIVISGYVRSVNPNFPTLVITDNENQDWYVIENEDREKLENMYEVKVRGKPEYEDIYHSGQRIGVKRYLRNIEILD